MGWGWGQKGDSPEAQVLPAWSLWGEWRSDVETGSADRPQAARRARDGGQRLPNTNTRPWLSEEGEHFSEMTSGLKVLCFLPTSAWRAGSPGPTGLRGKGQWHRGGATADSISELHGPTRRRDGRGAEGQRSVAPEDTVLPGQCRTDARGEKVAGCRVPDTAQSLCSYCYLCQFSHPPCSTPSSSASTAFKYLVHCPSLAPGTPP